MSGEVEELPTTVERELRTIYERYHALTSKMVVEEARPPGSPLHPYFEWDDSIAAERWRDEQAQMMIRKAKVKVIESSTSKERVRAYLPVPDPESGSNVYRDVVEIAQDPQLSEFVLKQMDRDWRSMKRRYGNYDEFFAMVAAEVKAREKGKAS